MTLNEVRAKLDLMVITDQQESASDHFLTTIQYLYFNANPLNDLLDQHEIERQFNEYYIEWEIKNNLVSDAHLLNCHFVRQL